MDPLKLETQSFRHVEKYSDLLEQSFRGIYAVGILYNDGEHMHHIPREPVFFCQYGIKDQRPSALRVS